MEVHRIQDFPGGWVVGNFQPTLFPTSEFEVGIKRMDSGAKEAEHFQMTAVEVTIVVSGSCRIGKATLFQGDIALIHPKESADFEALEDTVLLVIKSPSLPADKVLGNP